MHNGFVEHFTMLEWLHLSNTLPMVMADLQFLETDNSVPVRKAKNGMKFVKLSLDMVSYNA